MWRSWWPPTRALRLSVEHPQKGPKIHIEWSTSTETQAEWQHNNTTTVKQINDGTTRTKIFQDHHQTNQIRREPQNNPIESKKTTKTCGLGNIPKAPKYVILGQLASGFPICESPHLPTLKPQVSKTSAPRSGHEMGDALKPDYRLHSSKRQSAKAPIVFFPTAALHSYVILPIVIPLKNFSLHCFWDLRRLHWAQHID